jgi:hypothetical protein
MGRVALMRMRVSEMQLREGGGGLDVVAQTVSLRVDFNKQIAN